MGTQPASNDLAEDPDNDGIVNGTEVLLHTDVKQVDADKLSVTGYRYQVTKRGGVDELGRQCWDLRVDNVLLANTIADTRDAGPNLTPRGAGYNDLFITVSMRPGDDPSGRVLQRLFRHRTTRFPVGGIRSPPDGIVTVTNDNFTPGCPPPPSGTPAP
jgi:hypothetical protein